MTLGPNQTRELTIFRLFGAEPGSMGRRLLLVPLALAAWIGGVAFLAPYRPTEVSEILVSVAPGQIWYWAALAVPALLLAWSLVARDRLLGYAAATILAYVAGFWASGLLFALLPGDMDFPMRDGADLVAFILARLWFLIPLALLMGMVALLFRPAEGEAGPRLGVGDLSVTSRGGSMKEELTPWSRQLITGYFGVTIVLGLLLQLSVGFAPFSADRLGQLWWAVLVAALVNATVEEVIYRGFVQPAFIRLGGAAAGLWGTGLLFGLLHWGLSVGVLAALPVSLLIGLGSVLWGKAAYETRGLGFTIAAHFLIDVAVFAAYFV